jgi:hypothetical protein
MGGRNFSDYSIAKLDRRPAIYYLDNLAGTPFIHSGMANYSSALDVHFLLLF